MFRFRIDCIHKARYKEVVYITQHIFKNHHSQKINDETKQNSPNYIFNFLV